MYRTKNLFFVTFFLLGIDAEEIFAQVKNKQGIDFHIKKAKGQIKLDGIIDEADWTEADIATPCPPHISRRQG